MRSLVKLLGFSAVVGMLMISCQKEFTLEDGPDPVDPPVPVNDSNYLDKITIYDSSFGNYNVIRVIAYKYDVQRRVTSIIDSSEDNGLKPHKHWEYYYNGNDAIPYKSKYYRYGTASDTEIVYHYYDVNLKRVKDSVVQITTGSQTESTVTYTYSGNNIYSLHQNSFGSFTDTSRVDSRGNITYGARGGFDNDKFIYEFDNHPSPFVRLSNFRALSLYLHGEEYYDYFLLRNAANYTKCIERYAPDEYEYVNTYTYRADGFPVRKRSEDTDGTGYYEVEIYTYRSF